MNNSQDYKSIPYSSLDFLPKLTLTPSDRGIPPTPNSLGMQNDLSCSWSSQSQSQQTPKGFCKSFGGKSYSKEAQFLNEIRFSLHAVLSVVRDLPDKLKLLVTSSFNAQPINDTTLIENVKKFIEEKLVHLEKVLSLAEASFDISVESKKFQEQLLLSINEVKKNISVNQKEQLILQEKLLSKNTVVKKHLLGTKESCLEGINQLKNTLDVFQSSVPGMKFVELEMKIQGLIDIVMNSQSLLKANEDLLNTFVTQEKENTTRLNELSKEVTVMKCIMEALPGNLSVLLKKELKEFTDLSPHMKQNIRLVEAKTLAGVNKNLPFSKEFPKCSPVARITPQIKHTSINLWERSSFSDSVEMTKLNVIEFGNSSDDLSVLKKRRPMKRKLDWCSMLAAQDRGNLNVLRSQRIQMDVDDCDRKFYTKSDSFFARPNPRMDNEVCCGSFSRAYNIE